MLLRSNNPDLLEPGFRKIYDDAFKEVPQMAPKIFNVNSSTKQDEKDTGFTGFGLLSETGENGSVVYEDPLQMYDVTYVHKQYTKGFKVSEIDMEDDQYNVIKKKPAALARAARRTAETHAANVINRAFNTSYQGGDAVPLCSTLHPRSDGGSSQSNASATGITFTDTNLETGLLAARQQLDDKGMIIDIMPNKLIVPIDLEKDAMIITKSTLRPGSADNDVNVYQGKLQVLGWQYITQNNTMWLLQDSSQHALNWFWRVRPQFGNDKQFDTGAGLFKTRTRFSVGFSDWRGVWGSLGDGGAYSS